MTAVIHYFSRVDPLEAAAMALTNLTFTTDRDPSGNALHNLHKFKSLLMNFTRMHEHYRHRQHQSHGMLKGMSAHALDGGRHRGGVGFTDEVWLDAASTYGTNGSAVNLTATSTTLTFLEDSYAGSDLGAEAGNQGVAMGLMDECEPLIDLLDFCHLYYIPFIILVGLVGNLLSCVVFLNTHLRLRSSSYYLAALATADLGFLATLFLVWLNNNAGVVVFNRDGWCQGLVYVSSVCSFLSVWLIVAFTVERFIAVQYPLHRPHMCTVARAKGIVLALTVFALISHSYSFVTAGMVRGFVVPSGGGGTAGGDAGAAAAAEEATRRNSSEEGEMEFHPEIGMAEGESPLGGPAQNLAPGDEVCDMLEQYHEAMRVINIVDSVLTLIAPLTLIVLMNTMITRNLLRFGRRFRSNGGMAIGGSTLAIEHSGGGGGNAPETLAMGDVGGGGGGGSGSGGNSRGSGGGGGGGGGGGPSRETSEANLNKVAVPNSRRRPSQHSCHSTKSNSRHMRNNAANEVSLRCNHIRSSTRNLVSTRTQQSITKMLLLISTVFVLLNLPSYVIRLYIFLFFSLWKQRAPTSLWCLQQFFMLLYYTNFSINFLLYSMCGATFRRCLWQLIRKKLKTLSRSHCNPQRYT
ncbi:uncharacterized protein LOC124162760 [Ischnura elegans]|uniref:uncharacterized protein LOC124162760 n=1 Tax=Ischnura elegans TaxID=197161 RepID=UPI001ED8B03D|nr:uncharacterized protein LOC124162760 [Ischnura elegans]